MSQHCTSPVPDRLTIVVWLYVACCFHPGSLDVIGLLQASPEQTKKQQEDADGAMENNHEKKIAKVSRNQSRETAARPDKNLLSHMNASQGTGKL